MVDYTSALYLALNHPHAALTPWRALTEGVPAALREPAGVARLARAVASLVGGEEALVWPSTLHLFWDVTSALAERGKAVFVDACAYPIASWGALSAAIKGASVVRFGHHDPSSLGEALDRRGARDPIVITDGLCAGCGRSPPLARYRALVEERRGWLVLDDTQAIGVLGEGPCPEAPYGRGGGGSLRRQGITSERVIWAGSLAKGFGAPIAALSGASEVMRRIARDAPTRVHTSPPNAASIAAANRALAINAVSGDVRRLRLAENVRALRACLFSMGLGPSGGAFPIQHVTLGSGAATMRLYERLTQRGVQTALTRARCKAGTAITWLVNASHTARDVAGVKEAFEAIARGDKAHVDDGGWLCAQGAGVSAA